LFNSAFSDVEPLQVTALQLIFVNINQWLALTFQAAQAIDRPANFNSSNT